MKRLLLGAAAIAGLATCLPPHDYVGLACDQDGQCPDNLQCCSLKCADVAVCPSDAGEGVDSGTPPDSGSPDSGTPDSGAPDSGGKDSGTPDSGSTDSGIDSGTDAGSDAGQGNDSGFELLFNGGFEDMPPLGIGWTAHPGTQFQVGGGFVHSGSYSANLQSGGQARLESDAPSIAATASGLHCAQAYVWGSTPTPISLQLSRDLPDASILGTAGTYTPNSDAGPWGLVSCTINRNASDLALRLSVFANLNDAGEVSIDDASVWRSVDGGC